MMEMFTPDPEGIPEEEAELTYRLQQSIHDFYDPNNTGKCVEKTWKYCYEHKKSDNHQACGLPSYSVLHYDDSPVNHCGDYDCMHFEGYNGD